MNRLAKPRAAFTRTRPMFGLTFLLMTVPAPPDVTPPARPLALHRGMVIEDLERDVQRLQDGVLVRRSQLASHQRLLQKGAMSREDLEREKLGLKDFEAREAEVRSFLAIKKYERDLHDQGAPPDEKRAATLVLDWVRRKLAIALINADLQASNLEQVRALYKRKAVTKDEVDDAEVANDTALEAVAASLAREAAAAAELARAEDDGRDPANAAKARSLRVDASAARLRQLETAADVSRHRLAIARDRSRRSLLPASELILFERAVADADAALAAGRREAEGTEPVATDKPSARPQRTP